MVVHWCCCYFGIDDIRNSLSVYIIKKDKKTKKTDNKLLSVHSNVLSHCDMGTHTVNAVIVALMVDITVDTSFKFDTIRIYVLKFGAYGCVESCRFGGSFALYIFK